MLKSKKIAVTGGLSCGKSLVCRILQSLGTCVVSADKIVHQLLSSDQNIVRKVVDLLGSEVLVNCKVDRNRVANLVFNDRHLLRALELLIHPAVYAEIDRQYLLQECISQPPPLFVAEVPLLYESDAAKKFDLVIVVVADMMECRRRFEECKCGDQIEFDKRTARLIPLSEKIAQADYIIMNTGNASDLQCQTKELYQKLLDA